MASISQRTSRGRKKSQPKRALRKPKSRRRKKVQAKTSVEYNLLITATLMLLAIGAVMVFSASSTTSILSDGGLADSTFYLKRTLMVAALGLVLMHFAARRNLLNFRERLRSSSACFFLLFAVSVGADQRHQGLLVAGDPDPAGRVHKARLVLYGAHLFADRPDRVENVRNSGPIC
jgi:cell division protein FtsW